MIEIRVSAPKIKLIKFGSKTLSYLSALLQDQQDNIIIHATLFRLYMYMRRLSGMKHNAKFKLTTTPRQCISKTMPRDSISSASSEGV